MQTIIDYLKNTYHPLSVIICGAYTDESDHTNGKLDALVLIQDGDESHHTKIVDHVPLDVWVCPVCKFRSDLDANKIVRLLDGTIVFDTEHIGEKIKAEAIRHPADRPMKSAEEGNRRDLQCRIYPFGSLERYKYAVVCSSFNGKWILSKHKKRDTWETQGGHIEEGETPLECARRELFEESGIEDADLYPVCDYQGFCPRSCANGAVFLAVVHSLGKLPESEMQEIRSFDTLPPDLTYPQISPKLYAEAEKVLRCLSGEEPS